jgi:hypothetical protein
MENILINMNVSKNVYRITKMQKKLYLFNSNTIVIKTMNLIVSFCCPWHSYYVMVCVHLEVFYGETN